MKNTTKPIVTFTTKHRKNNNNFSKKNVTLFYFPFAASNKERVNKAGSRLRAAHDWIDSDAAQEEGS